MVLTFIQSAAEPIIFNRFPKSVDGYRDNNIKFKKKSWAIKENSKVQMKQIVIVCMQANELNNNYLCIEYVI